MNKSLQEAIKTVLIRLPMNEATVKTICNEINENKLYERRNKRPLTVIHILHRAKRFPNLFDIKDKEIISLKKNVSAFVKENSLDYKEKIDPESLLNEIKSNTKSLDDFRFYKHNGVYAIHFTGSKFPLFEANEYVKLRPIIYIGLNSNKSPLQNFIYGTTKESKLRKILASLLIKELFLNPEIQWDFVKWYNDKKNFALSSKDEDKLTTWIKNNLSISIYPLEESDENLEILKHKCIKIVNPIFNSIDKLYNPFYYSIKKIINELEIFNKMNSKFRNIFGVFMTSNIKNMGFNGFLKISELKNNLSAIPDKKGVYFVLRPNDNDVEFIEKGTGGFFKDRDPNVSINELKQNWIKESNIVYIGKAGGSLSNSTLRSRLKQYLSFGEGKKVGHWGGRFIWQIKNIDDFLICWKELETEDPRAFEHALLNEFENEYGRLPFANIIR